jgi:Na+-driven multidrug efflux pump
MEDLNKMKKHVTIVAAIHIGFGILGLIGALAAFFGLSVAKGFLQNEEVPDMVSKIITVLSVSLPLLITFMATLGLVGGIGLLSLQSWARYLIIVVAALGLLNIPIGTLKGVYTLWVLMQDETIKLFEKK